VENRIIRTLLDHGHEAYIIGGYVRDLILGSNSNDIDIVTNATPEEICEIFPGSGGVGKSFGVVLVEGVEVATYRIDRYSGDNMSVEYSSSLYEDTCRRDLTINALAMDLSGNILDFHGGKSDLENKIIRFIGDSKDRINEDPNRIIRACRFLALVNGSFSPQTYSTLVKHAFLCSIISPERIHKEIIKVMKIEKASLFFRACKDIGILEYIFPSLDKCEGVSQNRFHNEGLFEHNMRVGDRISCKFPMLKLSGYLHDVGKVGCKVYNEEKSDYTFYEHHKVGADIIREELIDLKFSNNEIDFVCSIIYNHMRDEPEGARGYRRALKVFSEAGISYRDYIRIRNADGLGKDPQYITDIRNLVSGFRDIIDAEEAFSLKDLDIDGNVVMETLQMKPSKEIGMILRKLLDMVMEQPELNKREILMDILKKGELLWK